MTDFQNECIELGYKILVEQKILLELPDGFKVNPLFIPILNQNCFKYKLENGFVNAFYSWTEDKLSANEAAIALGVLFFMLYNIVKEDQNCPIELKKEFDKLANLSKNNTNENSFEILELAKQARNMR